MKTAEERLLIKELRDARQRGEKGEMKLVLTSDLEEAQLREARQDIDYLNMQACIMGMIQGKPACDYCEAKRIDRCESMDKCSGCLDWFLRMHTEEEEKFIRQRAGVEEVPKHEEEERL